MTSSDVMKVKTNSGKLKTDRTNKLTGKDLREMFERGDMEELQRNVPEPFLSQLLQQYKQQGKITEKMTNLNNQYNHSVNIEEMKEQRTKYMQEIIRERQKKLEEQERQHREEMKKRLQTNQSRHNTQVPTPKFFRDETTSGSDDVVLKQNTTNDIVCDAVAGIIDNSQQDNQPNETQIENTQSEQEIKDMIDQTHHRLKDAVGGMSYNEHNKQESKPSNLTKHLQLSNAVEHTEADNMKETYLSYVQRDLQNSQTQLQKQKLPRLGGRFQMQSALQANRNNRLRTNVMKDMQRNQNRFK